MKITSYKDLIVWQESMDLVEAIYRISDDCTYRRICERHNGDKQNAIVAYLENQLMPVAYCLMPVAYCLLPVAYCLLPVAYCLLPVAYCLLPVACCLMPVAFPQVLAVAKRRRFQKGKTGYLRQYNIALICKLDMKRRINELGHRLGLSPPWFMDFAGDTGTLTTIVNRQQQNIHEKEE